MTSIPWPEDLCSGTATWWLGYMAADSDVDDDRYPQLKAGEGIRVNFTPDVSNAVLYRGVEGNKTIMPLVSTGVIDDEGYLCTLNEDGTAGQRGVVLPSSECGSLTPQGWTWNVTVTENRIRINRFSISLSPGEEIDLADYVPVDSSGGTHIVTEVETAERAEKAATQAGQFRQETKTDREATQRLRNEAESFRDAAGSSATSSAQSATTAGEILEQMQGMEITVDTSVGTRVYLGDTMIHGDTGPTQIYRWTSTGEFGDLPQGLAPNPSPNVLSGGIHFRRVGDFIYVNIAGMVKTSERIRIDYPDGFEATSSPYPEGLVAVNGNTFRNYKSGRSTIFIDDAEEGDQFGSENSYGAEISYLGRSNWPNSLPNA